jgi:hypothetical protein
MEGADQKRLTDLERLEVCRTEPDSSSLEARLVLYHRDGELEPALARVARD